MEQIDYTWCSQLALSIMCSLKIKDHPVVYTFSLEFGLRRGFKWCSYVLSISTYDARSKTFKQVLRTILILQQCGSSLEISVTGSDEATKFLAVGSEIS
jgi:hypothetical protein